MLKCPKCGSENSDHAFYCGKCSSELPRPTLSQRDGPAEEASQASRDENAIAQLEPRVAAAIKAKYDAQIAEEREAAASALAKHRQDAQVSTAVNIRRIALVLILGVVLMIGSTLFGLWISVFFTDPSDAKTITIVWLASATLIMIVGLYIIVFRKRLSKM
jgi:hypothetical protein